ncbi:hypothetical protein SARC_05558 [Sphaeroforma arctica JP610]|uniref:C2H2-type domain-containing protein n=1 Tax=Sphaeroforma arctica JP610 TaxID=667725 RepID=A0A0L0G009_9EUKA|nr:hypothetical protein SARC_05558 [Sphaeroforma arctica JP610]KNC82156.1 hypothetical protein SARC_05558 [Sphaeroforma arctica JP610]|eukprot:XP_014156058.1 hypothetical protein SARC_05558 [Sphaeroforma arctica JP610]
MMFLSSTSGSTGKPRIACEWPGCSVTNVSPSDYKIHMRSHTGERSYACTYPGCGRAFATSNVLKLHENAHVPVPTLDAQGPSLNPASVIFTCTLTWLHGSILDATPSRQTSLHTTQMHTPEQGPCASRCIHEVWVGFIDSPTNT